VGVEREFITPKKTWVEESMAETLDIDMCLTSRICERQNRWRNRVLCGHFKTFVNCGFPASAKKVCFSIVFCFTTLGARQS
jgi:hypothetical protein